MRASLLVLLLALPSSVGAAPGAEPWKGLAFRPLSEGKELGPLMLGASPDGAKYAYLCVIGTTTREIYGRVVERSGARTLAGYLFPSEDSGDKEETKALQAFFARVEKEGIHFDRKLAWTEKGDRLVAPNGKTSMRWRTGPVKGKPEEERGREDTLTIENVEGGAPGDKISLVEEYVDLRREQDVPGRSPPRAYDLDKDNLLILYRGEEGPSACRVKVVSYGGLTDGALERGYNNQAMSEYRAGHLREAQNIFQIALKTDASQTRARYNLAAVSAKLGDDALAIEALTLLAKTVSPERLRWKIRNDSDFTAARKRKRFAEAMKTLLQLSDVP